MKLNESGFLKKVGKGVRNTALGLTAAGMMAHAVSEDRPKVEYQKDISTQSIDSIYSKYSPETKAELEALEGDYADRYFNYYPDAVDFGITRQEVRDRFRNLVAKYGSDITIKFTDSEDNTFLGKAHDAIFQKIFQKNQNHAHYAGNTIFYPNTPSDYEVTEEGDSTVVESRRLEDFLAELSHHINHDSRFVRIVHYVENLVSTGLRQHETYSDPEAVEFQAHRVVESALVKYLMSRPEDFKVSFEEIHKNYFSYYQAIMENYSDKLPKSDVDLLMDVYVLSVGKNEWSREAELEKGIFERVEQAEKYVETFQFQDKTVKKKAMSELMIWDALEPDGSGIPMERINDFFHCQHLMGTTARRMFSGDFRGIDDLSQDKTFIKNFDFIEYFELAKHNALKGEQINYEDFLDELSPTEARVFLKHEIPFIEKMLDQCDKSYKTGDDFPSAVWQSIHFKMRDAEHVRNNIYRADGNDLEYSQDIKGEQARRDKLKIIYTRKGVSQ